MTPAARAVLAAVAEGRLTAEIERAYRAELRAQRAARPVGPTRAEWEAPLDPLAAEVVAAAVEWAEYKRSVTGERLLAAVEAWKAGRR